MLGSLFVILFFAVVGLVLFLQKDDGYDERQTVIMDRGGRYGLLTVLLLNAVFYIFSVFDSVPELSVRFTSTMSIWSGILVASLYAIWNHAYFSLKSEKTNGFTVVMLIMGIPNLLIGVVELLGLWGGSPDLTKGVSFLIFGISCFCIALTIILRNHLDGNEEGDL